MRRWMWWALGAAYIGLWVLATWLTVTLDPPLDIPPWMPR